MSTDKIIKSGLLQKRGEINKAWKQRWFVLQNDKLFYYRDSLQVKPISHIPLDQSIARACTEKTGKENCFEIVTRQRVYQLAAKTATDMQEWMKLLSAHTVLHAENEMLNVAEELIARATLDQYLAQHPSEQKLLAQYDQRNQQFLLHQEIATFQTRHSNPNYKYSLSILKSVPLVLDSDDEDEDILDSKSILLNGKEEDHTISNSDGSSQRNSNNGALDSGSETGESDSEN